MLAYSEIVWTCLKYNLASAYNNVHWGMSSYKERTWRMPSVPLTYICVCERMIMRWHTLMPYALVWLHFKRHLVNEGLNMTMSTLSATFLLTRHLYYRWYSSNRRTNSSRTKPWSNSSIFPLPSIHGTHLIAIFAYLRVFKTFGFW